jgi:predicted nucleotidyltransferase
MPRKAIVNLVRRFLTEVERAGIPVYAGVLYGSYARGDARKDSDIDLLIVTSREKPARPYHDVSLLWGLRGLVDWRIEPLLVGMKRWKEDEGSPLLAIIRKEGRIISPVRPPACAPRGPRKKSPSGSRT